MLAACSGSPNVDVLPPDEDERLFFESVSDSIVSSGLDFLAQTLGSDELAFLLSIAFKDKPADVRVDAIKYYTNDPDGKRIIVSGIVAYPVSENIRGVILAGHGTIGASREAPSEKMNDWMSLLALAGYMVISPDYIGYGASKHLPHPYLHAGLTAATSIDMYFAVGEYMALRGKPLPNGDISVLGYSQGGSAALAIQKLAEEEYTKEIRILRVTAGGGPYDLSFFFEQMKGGNFMPSPFIPMTILGLDYGDKLRLDMAQFFIEPLLTEYKAWILSKDFTVGEIKERIGTDFLAPSLYTQEHSPGVQKLYASLAANSLVDWTPRAPITLIHGRTDDVVPVSCSEKAFDSFSKRGCTVELKTTASDHTGTILFFILQVLEQFT